MATETITKQQVLAAFNTTVAVAECIRDLGHVPSGHLYAHLMCKLDIHQYQSIIDMLVRGKMVKIENHELIWIGPAALPQAVK